RHTRSYGDWSSDVCSSDLRMAAAFAATVGIAAAFATPAAAQAGVKVGTLTCNVSSGWGFVFGSSRTLNCTFAAPGRYEYYVGNRSEERRVGKVGRYGGRVE